MAPPLILASASTTRLQLLQSAGLSVTARPARIDEDSLRAALAAEGASPRDMADALAEAKARKLAAADPAAVVIGCDQILALGRRVFAKPASRDEARAQIASLAGQTHHLYSAVVLYHQGGPVWRHLATARMTMRQPTGEFLDGYLDRHWPALAQSVGGYQLESEGIRLFSAIEGDYFGILGLPLLPLLDYLSLRGFIPS